jgi:orotate phosphoribosyltransferase
MEEYKQDFIQFLLETGSLKIFENPSDDRTLKSGRVSPWFVNIGDFNDGHSTSRLAGFYADAIIDSRVKVDVLYGIPDKGVGLAAPVAMEMSRRGKNVGWVFSRKDEKKHGEASNLSVEDRIKALMVGKIPRPRDAIVQLDDVFTAGETKYEANRFLTGFNRTNLPLLAIAVDRQEVAIDGKEAISEYAERTGTKVVSIVNAMDIYEFLKVRDTTVSKKGIERLVNYIKLYGTQDAKRNF